MVNDIPASVVAPVMFRTPGALSVQMSPVGDLGPVSARRFGMGLAAGVSMARHASSGAPFCLEGLQRPDGAAPAPEELVRWMWTGLAGGAAGMVLGAVDSQDPAAWTLRNLQGGRSPRSAAADAVCSILVAHRDLFAQAVPLASPIAVLYTRESERAGRQCGREALARDSALAFFELLSENGLYPDMMEMDEYDWSQSSYRGKCVVLSGQLAVPVRFYPLLREFVKKGGKLIVEGLSFYFDEHLSPVFPREFPLSDVLGGVLEDTVSFEGERKRKFGSKKLWVAGQEGCVHNEASGESLPFLRNKYGRGTVLWIPSAVALGAVVTGHRRRFSKFLLAELAPVLAEMPIRFRRLRKGICMQVMQVPSGYVTVVTSHARHRRKVRMRTSLKVAKQLFMNPVGGHEGRARRRKVKVHAGQTIVALWKAK